MSNKITVWQEDFSVRAYQVDHRAKLKPTAVAQLFQEAAGNHATANGAGFHDIFKMGKMWVLSRLKFEVNGRPVLFDQVTLKTWVKSVNDFNSEREFVFEDKDGNVLVKGSSLWFMLDMKTRRPSALEPVKSYFNIEENLSSIGALEKINVEGELKFTDARNVKYSDLDPNNHVNNVKYLEWALDSYPFSYVQKNKLLGFELNFLAETRMGDEVILETHEVNLENRTVLYTKVKNKATDKLVCVVSTEWKKAKKAVDQAKELELA
ncbi:acyl-[acyl-carrier-protein] thioesterase [Sediminitomix flava]|uniref:Acyl-ACP thioesterase n=1 Tax=Sediminitomix flava TaxID=379075 RepID=A0A315ZA50_SEDFL|nr:acyl-ACP thioesterase domain-containing protein [Sediminitomix flava]PWJ42152.1 acyl-ACP thioesterase [Sediminitomix flava]